MIFDTYDHELLKLIGLCRYMPTGLLRRYDAPVLSQGGFANLQLHGLVRVQSDRTSYQLSKKGKEVLAEMGYRFPGETRTCIRKPSYRRKLKSAQWNVLLYLAGFDVFYLDPLELAGTDCGYVSSLALRADAGNKALAGTRFLGILKIRDQIYIPYHIESTEEWIVPGYEREIFSSQAAAIRNVKQISLILTGEALEELWEAIHPPTEREQPGRGMRYIDRALEELGSDYLLLPFGRDGVIQSSLLKIAGSRERIAAAIRCEKRDRHMPLECDGVIENDPCIIAVDFNVKRIVRALAQIRQVSPAAVPRICCLQFQKSTLFKLLRFYGCQKTMIITIDKYDIYTLFPELTQELERDAYRTKGGLCIEVAEKKTAKRRMDGKSKSQGGGR